MYCSPCLISLIQFLTFTKLEKERGKKKGGLDRIRTLTSKVSILKETLIDWPTQCLISVGILSLFSIFRELEKHFLCYHILANPFLCSKKNLAVETVFSISWITKYWPMKWTRKLSFLFFIGIIFVFTMEAIFCWMKHMFWRNLNRWSIHWPTRKQSLEKTSIVEALHNWMACQNPPIYYIH